MRFVWLMFVLLLSHINYAVCMMIEGKGSSAFDGSKVPTLQQLCINVIRKTIIASDIYDLVQKDKFERYSNIPESLKNKIASVPMCLKLGHEFMSTIPTTMCVGGKVVNIASGPGIFDSVYLDEENDHVYLLSKENKTLTTFKMGQKEEITSFEMGESYTDYANGSLICWVDWFKEKSKLLHVVSDGIKYANIILPEEYKYGSPHKLLKNQRTLIVWKGDGQFLFDLDTYLPVIEEHVKDVQYNFKETLCLIKHSNGDFFLYDASNPIEYKLLKVFSNLKDAVFNPNGKHLVIKTQDNKNEYMSVTGETLFALEDGGYALSGCSFSDNYVIVRESIVNTNNGMCCFSVELPIHSKIYFYKKFLVVIHNGIAYLIRIKDFPEISNGLTYDLDAIKKLNICHIFENVSFPPYRYVDDKPIIFHPSGDYIVTLDNCIWKLIHIKSKECVATIDNVLSYHFSQPTGKMLYIRDKYGRGYKVFHCRHDFTLEEVLLTRYITENNIDHVGLSQYPHLQEIYDGMEKDKQNFDTYLQRTSLLSWKNATIIGAGLGVGFLLYTFFKK